MSAEPVAVVGAGAWGTALAQVAARAGHDVVLVGRDAGQAAAINASHRNAAYLGALDLSERIVAATAFPARPGLVVMAVPAQATRTALAALAPGALDGVPVVLSAKGLEAGTLSRQSDILAALAPAALPLVLSGPSFAEDVAAGRPTAVTLAAGAIGIAERVAARLAGPSFRPYASDDLIGVEFAGALKNVYALACGAVEGAALGASARASLIARAYAEMGRLVVALGGKPATLGGLAGLGDLALSCTSTQSRNYRYGMALGRGRSAAEAAGSGLAEGVFTAPVAQRIAAAKGIDAPLVDAVNLLLGGTTSIAQIVSGLMSRPLKRED